MVAFRRKPQAVGEIQLSPKRVDKLYASPVDHFFSDETIEGVAVFTLPPGVDFASSKISLKGIIRTTVEETNTGALGKAWRTEKLNFLGVLFDNKQRKGFLLEEGTVRVPFRFNLSQCERLASFISDLPPSLDSVQEGHRSSDCQYDITYSITATAVSKRGTIASTSRKVFILPACPDVFSDCHSDVSGEYFWAEPSNRQSKAQRPNLSSKIEVAGQEPESLVLNADGLEHGGSTEVPFVLKVSTQTRDSLDRKSLPSRCQVKAQLVTKTHLTPDGLKQLQSNLEYAPIGGRHETRVRRDQDQDIEIPISSWEECVACTTDPFSVARFSFTFSVSGDKSPLPTFFTPLLSRRYFIDLTLSFPESSGETFKLSLPLEMVYGAAHAESLTSKKNSTSSVNDSEASL